MNVNLRNAKNRKKGFTLVELLIVIIIIGILAGAMLLVAGSGTDKANATKIVSDLRSLKSAALMYYADNQSWPTPGSFDQQLKGYMDRKLVAADFAYANTSGDYVGYKGALLTDGVKSKLAAMTSDGLFNAADGTDTAYTNGATVWMKVK